MRWSGQELTSEAPAALPGMAKLSNLVRSVSTPDFAGIRFHEVMAKSALNRVPQPNPMPFDWTINPYRGCSHACTFCFARNTHTYLDLDAGKDFDNEIIVKVNVVDVVARELAKPSWRREGVALGTNTDPYQRAEGRYRLMPGIIASLAHSGTPFSILTKGTLLRRDLRLIAEAATQVPVDLAVTIAIHDDQIQPSAEPGAPSTRARLETVRAISELGMPVTVFLMPVLPYLTDTVDHLDRALAAIAGAGATAVTYSALHLRTGAREWFMQWLESERPDLVPRYRGMYRASAYAPKDYRRWLGERIHPLLRKHGLEHPRSREGLRALPAAGSLVAAELPASLGQPTLF